MDNTTSNFVLGGPGASGDFRKLIHNDDDPSSPYTNHNISCEFYDTNAFISNFKNSSNFSLMSLNIQSLPSKFSDFEELINELSSNNCSFDVICLQEIWRISNPDMYLLDNYHNLVYKSRKDNVQGGGVGFYLKKSVKFKQLDDISIFIDKVIETFFIEVEICSNKKIIIGSIYRPNSSTINISASDQLSQFNDSLNTIFSSLGNKKVYILGDVNIDILKFESHKPTANYVDSIFSLGCLQIVTKPTRCTHRSSSLIDHIITNVLCPKYVSGVLISSISDHFPVFCFLDQLREPSTHKTVTSRNFSQANINKFKDTLSKTSWQPTLNETDPQKSFDIFSSLFNSLLDENFPKKECRFNKNYHKKEKWLTKGLLTSRRHKNELFRSSFKM